MVRGRPGDRLPPGAGPPEPLRAQPVVGDLTAHGAGPVPGAVVADQPGRWARERPYDERGAVEWWDGKKIEDPEEQVDLGEQQRHEHAHRKIAHEDESGAVGVELRTRDEGRDDRQREVRPRTGERYQQQVAP